jgi:hypothetical protein
VSGVSAVSASSWGWWLVNDGDVLVVWDCLEEWGFVGVGMYAFEV